MPQDRDRPTVTDGTGEPRPFLSGAASFVTVISGACSGLLFALALPPFGYSSLAWIFAVPLLMVCIYRPAPEALVAAYACGLVAAGQAVYGVFGYSQFIGLLLLLICPLWVVLPLAVFLWCRRFFPIASSVLVIPFSWVFTETLFLELFSLPMDSSITLARDLPAVQFASVLGAAGLTFALIMTAALLALGIVAYGRGRRKSCLYWTAMAFMIPLSLHILGHALMQEETDDSCLLEVQVAQPVIPIVQSGNSWIDIAQRKTIRKTAWRYLDTAAASSANVFIWPEGSGGFTSFRAGDDAVRFTEFAKKNNRHLFVTATDTDETGRRFNSIFSISPHGQIGKYDKINLLPSSESATTAGTGAGVATASFGPVGLSVCFDICFPEHVRGSIAHDPQFLLVSTSDVAFGISSMPYLHMAESIMRAVENRRSVVHASNGGPSAVIDPYGRILHQSRFLEPALMNACIPDAAGNSFFYRAGYLFRYGCVVVAFAVITLLLMRQARRRDNMHLNSITATRRISTGALLSGLAGSVIVSFVMVALSALLVSKQAPGNHSSGDIIASFCPAKPIYPEKYNNYSREQLGLIALVHLASFYGIEITTDEILERRGDADPPVTLDDLAREARYFGMVAEPVYRNARQLHQDDLPAIIGIGVSGMRYAVLYRIDDEFVSLFDPVQGYGDFPLDNYRQYYNGKTLFLKTPQKEFIRGAR